MRCGRPPAVTSWRRAARGRGESGERCHIVECYRVRQDSGPAVVRSRKSTSGDPYNNDRKRTPVTIPSELQAVLVSTPDTLSGAIRFRGTRVPVQALIDTLSRGLPVSDFLEGFPDVAEAQAMAVLQWEQNHAREIFGLLAS